MTALKDAYPLPAVSVNKFVWDEFKKIDSTLATTYSGVIPFFPLADSRAGDAGWGNKPYVVYDLLFKPRTRAFPHIHKVQVLYFVRGGAEDALTWSNTITHILDREDESAQDINYYLAAQTVTPGIYFHRTKVFQIDMANEERMDLSVRQYYTESLIVELEYHVSDTGFA